MPTLLVVDDEPSIRYSIQHLFEGGDIDVVVAEDGQQARQRLLDDVPDAVLLDIRLGVDDGLKVFEELRRIDPKCLVIFITGHGTSETAIEAMKRGAFDYLVKPLDANQLTDVVHKACEIRRLMRTPALLESAEHEVDNPDLIIGGGAAMRSVFKQIGRVAAQDINVLILGESGTGKELVARALYHHSRRCQMPFLAINCAALPETLLESELFGHEKGAFTGADRRRIGKFQQADGGTMFLDEVGDMAASTQAKMLRLLQDGTFERIGGNEVLASDVRVISATNRHLEKLIEEGKFRLDLFYRLRGVTIHLPPLRERTEDIPELAHYFLFRFNRDLQTDVSSIDEETLERLQNYAWPGNVRELQSVIRESLLRSAGPVLLPEFLPEHIGVRANEVEIVAADRDSAVTWASLAELLQTDLQSGSPGLYRRSVEKLDELILRGAMLRTGGNQAAAAELLGVSRPTLRAKLRQLAARRTPVDNPTERPAPEKPASARPTES
ncbi:MAG: sigma-54 dependent transcriptional regulator [Pirellulales bacterium]